MEKHELVIIGAGQTEISAAISASSYINEINHEHNEK